MCGLYDSNNIFSKLNVMLDRPNKMENRRKEKETVSENKETKKEEKAVDEKEDTKKEKKTVTAKCASISDVHAALNGISLECITNEGKLVDESRKTEKETVNGNGETKKEKTKEIDTVDVRQVVMKKIWTYVIADWQGFT